MAKKIIETPFDKKTTRHILEQELPEVDLVEISAGKTSKRTKSEENLILQSRQASEQSPYSTQLRDIKEIQMHTYSTGGLVETDQVSTGATICSVIATILLTVAVIFGILYGIILALNLDINVAKDDTLSPQVPENCLLVMEKVESYNDVFEGDVVNFNGDDGEQSGIVFWTLVSSEYPEGHVLLITSKDGMAKYNEDLENNSKLDPATQEAAARGRYFLEEKSIEDLTGKLSFSVSNVGPFVVFLFDNWYFVLIGLALLVVLLFLLKLVFDKKFEAELFRQMEEADAQRTSTKEMIKQDLIKTQQKFSEDFNTSKDMFDLLEDSQNKLEKPVQLDPKKAKIQAELEKRRRAQIEKLSALAQKQNTEGNGSAENVENLNEQANKTTQGTSDNENVSSDSQNNDSDKTTDETDNKGN